MPPETARLQATTMLHVTGLLHEIVSTPGGTQAFFNGENTAALDLVSHTYSVDPGRHDYDEVVRRKIEGMWDDPTIFAEFGRMALRNAIWGDNASNLLRQNAELQRQGERDGLTGLLLRDPWRARLEAAVAKAEGAGRRFAVVIFDLDGFKLVNSMLGAQEGDRKLVKTANVLLGNTHEGADTAGVVFTVGRMGGDEFAVILEERDPSDPIDVPVQRPGEVPRTRATMEEQAAGATARLEEQINAAILDPRVPRLRVTGVPVVWQEGMTSGDMLAIADQLTHQKKLAAINEIFGHMDAVELAEYIVHATYLREKLQVDSRVIPLPGERG